MIRNIIIVSWRNMLRNRVLTSINISSLTLGMTLLILIGLWISDEYHVNRFHDSLDQLYRVRTNANWGELQTFSNTPGPLRDVMKEEVPEIKAATRLSNSMDFLLSLGEKNVESNGMYVDTDFMEMFSFPTIEGDPISTLSSIDQIIITKNTANRLFGGENPIGQVIKIDNATDFSVGAVLADPPKDSEITFEWLLPWQVFEKDRDWSKTWGNVSFTTYVMLTEQTHANQIADKIAHLGQAKEFDLEFFLQPFEDQYLYGNFEAGLQTGGRIDYLKLFGIIAIFLLIIACINFANLSSARARTREKEIGVRKTMGASKNNLVFQFLTESLLIATISFSLAIFLSKLLLEFFNSIFGKSIDIPFASVPFWLMASGLIVVTGLLAGTYPSFILSQRKPREILAGTKINKSDRSISVRRGMVIFQFSIAIFLILSTLVINQQIDFVKESNLGLDRNNLFYTTVGEDKTAIMVNALAASGAIKYVTSSSDNPMSINSSSGDLSWPGKNKDQMVLVAPMVVGDHFIEAMGLELVAGRGLSSNFTSDTSNYVVNEMAVKVMGLDDPIGQEIDFWNGPGKIVGVIKDYHLESLHAPIRPQILTYHPENYALWIKPHDGRVEEAIRDLKDAFTTINPGHNFVYTFADDEYEKEYKNEILTATIANIFSGIAIFISCLGLLGLVVFIAERKQKELIIRKVLGASVANLIQILSREFLLLIVLAAGIGLPLGWYLIDGWLEAFSYGINVQGWHLFLAISLPLIIALVITSGIGYRVFKNDPVKVLKDN